MKLITLRIDEEEKARLEQLAEQGDITLSRALREGGALYLEEQRAKAHRAVGGETTFLGIRRDTEGRRLSKPSEPSAGDRARVRGMRTAVYERGLGSIRKAWEAGASAALVLGALGQWLSVVGQLYVYNDSEVGWDHFLRDYCRPYAKAEAAAELRCAIRGALVVGSSVDVGAVLDAVGAGFVRLLEDAETQELVRKQVLPSWQVFERKLSE